MRLEGTKHIPHGSRVGRVGHSLAGEAAVEVSWHVSRLQQAAGQEQQP